MENDEGEKKAMDMLGIFQECQGGKSAHDREKYGRIIAGFLAKMSRMESRQDVGEGLDWR